METLVSGEPEEIMRSDLSQAFQSSDSAWIETVSDVSLIGSADVSNLNITFPSTSNYQFNVLSDSDWSASSFSNTLFDSLPNGGQLGTASVTQDIFVADGSAFIAENSSFSADDSAFTTRDGRSADTDNKRLKRQAQNRVAQRAFRERKEKYILELEERVVGLNKKMAALELERRRLDGLLKVARTEIDTLRSLPLPAGPPTLDLRSANNTENGPASPGTIVLTLDIGSLLSRAKGADKASPLLTKPPDGAVDDAG